VMPTLLLTALAPAIWGTTYIVTTELMPPDRPLLTALLRALPVGILLTVASRQLPRGAWWWRTTVLGTLNIGAFFALLFVAAYRLPGGVAATAGALQPIVAAALAAWLLGERFTRRVAGAGIAGVIGVALLVLGPQAALDPIGIVAALAGTVSMAAGVVLTKRWGRPVGLLTATGWQLVAGGLVLVPLAIAIEGAPPAFTVENWLGTGWLALVGTGIAYNLWFRGIERLPVNALTFLGLLSPLVATVLGWTVLGQGLSSVQMAGALLIAFAVITPQLGNRPRRQSGSNGPPNAIRQEAKQLLAGALRSGDSVLSLPRSP
jgi:probable blue pigment (indigoidine) exporter